MTGSGLSERSGFRARAGTLTLLFLASAEHPSNLREMLAQLDEAMFDPEADPELWEPDEDGSEDEESEGHAGESEDAMEEEWIGAPGERDDIELEIPPEIETRLTPAGKELVFVGQVLEGWLRSSPTGPLRLGEEEASLALAALVVGWSSTVIHALSGAALTIEELERTTGAVRREALEARLGALEDAGLVELLEGAGGEVRYAATTWLRQGIAPLAAAARHERRQRNDEAAPPDVLDVGAAFLLTLPLVELPADIAGPCRLGVQMPGEGQVMAGATGTVEQGHVVSIDLQLDPSPATWATGSPIDWLEAVVVGANKVKLGGDTRLADALIGGLHERLFAELT